MLALGLAFFLSAVNVKYRDTSHIWEIIMQAAFYATPIIYPLAIVVAKSGFIAKIMLMNPLAQAIQDARYSLITHQTATVANLFHKGWYILIPLVITLIIFVMGTLYFKKNSKYFAENI
jgi:ABC-2 type transport system permease protein